MKLSLLISCFITLAIGEVCPEGTFYDSTYGNGQYNCFPQTISGIYIPQQLVNGFVMDEAKCIYPMKDAQTNTDYNIYRLNWNDGQGLCQKFTPASPNCSECKGTLATIHTNDQNDLINNNPGYFSTVFQTVLYII